MATWGEFERASPELAAFGKEYFGLGWAYLATVDRYGSPRVYPVSALVRQGHLLVRMEPTSPKGDDLRRDGRYAMHATVRDRLGESGEFLVRGRATLVEDPAIVALAPPEDTYTLLFDLLYTQRVFDHLRERHTGPATVA